MSEPLLEVRDLKVHYPVRRGLLSFAKSPIVLRAVDGVSFDVRRGEVLAVVGESGCGKTTMGKAIIRLLKANAGSVNYGRQNLLQVQGNTLRSMRQKLQMIFQDPYESLNPRQSIFDIVAEPLRIHGLAKDAVDLEQRVYVTLEAVGLHPAPEIASRYPHLLSGGQRQRVAIAATMILEPEFIVADEPVSMLDVSIRAEIIRLMLDLQKKNALTYLFITHDLSLAWMIADRIMVLYLGKVVEMGPAQEVIHAARHPYTRALVSVIPIPEPGKGKASIVLQGETPSAINVPSGCRFHPRCWLWQKLNKPAKCVTSEPELLPVGTEYLAACHFTNQGA